MKKILFITRDLDDQEGSGGLVVSKRNLDFLKTIYGSSNIDIFTIEKPSILTRIVNLVFKQSYGQTLKNFSRFKSLIKKDYLFVFYNSSIYGGFVKYATKINKMQIVFYHNIEYKFYMDKYNVSKKTIDLLYAKYIRFNEYSATKKSNIRITLNNRDSKDLLEFYGEQSSFELPISFPQKQNMQKIISNENFYLFVGSNFFANTDGVSWFIENVMNYIDMDFYIIGSVCNSLRKYENNKHIKLLGFVDNLDFYYKNASFVVSPIFKGSGMKTKTIEALSFGKTIFGTKEAFEGINIDYTKIGGLCMTAEEFIKKINSYDNKRFNPNSYELFISNYSDEAVINQLRIFLKKNGL